MNTYQFLSTIDPFRKLVPEQLSTVARSYHGKSFPVGSFLCRQGHPIRWVGIIESGLVKAVVLDRSGNELTTEYLRPGDLVFDIAVLSGAAASATLISLEPSVCIVQAQQKFIDTIDAHAQLKHFFYRNAALGIRWGYKFFSGRQKPALDKEPEGEFTPPCIRKALAYIDGTYHKKISLQMLARESATSTSRFSRLFKNHVGMSLKRYINHKRIEAAKVLISRNGYNVTEAGYAVGFCDASYFTRVCINIEGHSPKHFFQLREKSGGLSSRFAD